MFSILFSWHFHDVWNHLFQRYLTITNLFHFVGNYTIVVSVVILIVDYIESVFEILFSSVFNNNSRESYFKFSVKFSFIALMAPLIQAPWLLSSFPYLLVPWQHVSLSRNWTFPTQIFCGSNCQGSIAKYLCVSGNSYLCSISLGEVQFTDVAYLETMVLAHNWNIYVQGFSLFAWFIVHLSSQQKEAQHRSRPQPYLTISKTECKKVHPKSSQLKLIISH